MNVDAESLLPIVLPAWHLIVSSPRLPPPFFQLLHTHTLSLSLSLLGSLRSELISEGAIGVLVQCLSFADSAVQSGACVAIGMLACDTSARQEVTNVTDLCHTLSSSHCFIR